MLYYFYLTWCISAIYFICEKKETNISDLSKIYSFIEDITSLILRPSTLILNISYTQYAINIPYIEVITITYQCVLSRRQTSTFFLSPQTPEPFEVTTWIRLCTQYLTRSVDIYINLIPILCWKVPNTNTASFLWYLKLPCQLVG